MPVRRRGRRPTSTRDNNRRGARVRRLGSQAVLGSKTDRTPATIERRLARLVKGATARPAVSRSSEWAERPFIGALYQDLLTRTLCSPIPGGAARAVRWLRIRVCEFARHNRRMAAYGDAVEDYGVAARPIRLPSGSVKWPTVSPVGARSGPNVRVPPRRSASCSAASTSGTPT
jgi:hypothetical protein